jgi:hypothetical protein
LVVLDQQRMLLPEVLLHEEGHAQERRLIAEGLHHVHADDLWIEDRHVCTRALMCGMAQRGAVFIVRQHRLGQGACLGRPVRKGASRSGTVYAHPLLVHAPDRGETMRVRRITVKLTEPTRNGDTARPILTNGPTSRAAAGPLARLSGKRWRIATAFGEITTTLACERNTLAYPKAALVTFCLALLAYNAVALIKAALRRAHGPHQVNAEVSGSSLALEMGRTYDGMMMAIPAPQWALCRVLSAKAFADALRELASSVHLMRYQKHPRGPKKTPPERTAYQHGKHVSTAKLLAKR